MSFEPQYDIRLTTIPIDKHLETTPLEVEAGLLACPDGASVRLEILAVAYRANTLPIDTTDLQLDIEHIDDSDTDSLTDLIENFNLDDGKTVLVSNLVWRGSQILDPGDVINGEFTVTSPTTASEGAALTVEYRVVKYASAGSGFEPQTNVGLDVIGIDAALETTPTAVEVCLLQVPDGGNYSVDLLSVNYRANTLPIDGSNNVNIDLEWIDDSAADVVANLVAAYTLDDNRTALINNEVWRGVQRLDPGDVVNAEFDVTTPDTASEGAAFIVEYRIVGTG